MYDIDRLEFTRVGSGDPPVLLLHGWGGDCRTLARMGEAISGHRVVWSISLPGFGQSPEPPEAWGSAEYTDVALEWMTAKGLSGADIIAHSFGGRAAIGLAAKHPDAVNRMALLGSAGLVLPRSVPVKLRILFSKALHAMGGSFGGAVEVELERFRRRLGSSDWQAANPVMRGVLSRVIREDMSGELSTIRHKTLLVFGENDSSTPPEMGKRMSELLTNCRLVLIRDAGHYCFIDNPGEILSLIWSHFELTSAW